MTSRSGILLGIYVDGKACKKYSNSTMQSSLDAIALWSSSNWMKLNAKKCKEMQICFLKEISEPIRLRIEDQALELVTSHKVLGLVIQNNLEQTYRCYMYGHKGI